MPRGVPSNQWFGRYDAPIPAIINVMDLLSRFALGASFAPIQKSTPPTIRKCFSTVRPNPAHFDRIVPHTACKEAEYETASSNIGSCDGRSRPG